MPRRVDELQILVGQRQDRDLRKIDLLRARQRQQQIERALEALHVDDHRRLGGAAVGLQRGVEIVGAHEPVIRCDDGRLGVHHLREHLARGVDVELFRRLALRQRRLGALRGLARKLRRCAGDRGHLGEVAVAMEHDVAAGGQCGAAALGDRAGQSIHRDVIAHQQALESDKPANHFAHHCDRSGGRCTRVDGRKHNMGGHAERQAGKRLKGRKIGRFQGGPVGIDHRQPVVAVGRRRGHGPAGA